MTVDAIGTASRTVLMPGCRQSLMSTPATPMRRIGSFGRPVCRGRLCWGRMGPRC